MPIVTLTTDYGQRDYYVAMLKGAILRNQPNVTIVDISHEIPCFDIVQAAFVFRNARPSFPPGTIHLLSVSDQPGEAGRMLLTKWEEHYIVGPDNGLFSLIFDRIPSPIYAMPLAENSRFPVKNAFADAVSHFADQRPLDVLLEPAGEIVQRITLQPVIGRSRIQGTVIYIDRYGNAITNIPRSLFEKVGQERRFQVFFKRHDPIGNLHRHYHEVPVGEPLCLFNSAGLLEIALNMGNAGSLLGLSLDDAVQIDFLDGEGE